MNALPARKIFTIGDYHKMIDAGVFIGNSNWELVEGEIVKKMTVGDYHISCVNRLNYLFSLKLAGKAIVSVQNPVVISEISEPEPDIALLKFREDFYASGKATAKDVLLLVEVSDSTAGYDRQTKTRIYAEAEIAEVWLVNLPRQIVEVYDEPAGGKYKVVRKLGKNEKIHVNFLPEISFTVAEILG
ncbi:MAG: Uma2 family endonuclease [Pyrinomonadaceae bacterium]